MAPNPARTKRMLQGLEPEDATTRVTRQKKALALANTEESPLLKDGGSQPHKDGGSRPHKDGGRAMHMDGGSPMHMDEGSPMHMVERSSMHMGEGSERHMEGGEMRKDSSHMVTNVAGFSEQQEQDTLHGGKLLLCYFNVSMGRPCHLTTVFL